MDLIKTPDARPDAQVRAAVASTTGQLRITVQPRIQQVDAAGRTSYTWWRGVLWSVHVTPAEARQLRQVLSLVFTLIVNLGLDAMLTKLRAIARAA